VINFGGIKFFPEEVEAVLDAHPDVRESRVSGLPHERWGAVAVAEFVAHDIARPPTATVLGQHCRERLAGLKGAGAISPGRGAAAHAEREAAAYFHLHAV